VPIFSGGQRTADVRDAEELLRQSQLQLSQAEKQTTLDLTQQRAEIERAQAAISARQQTARQAAESYELTVLAYDKGNATALQVSDARLQWRTAQVNEAQAVFDYLAALSRFLRAAGVAPTPAVLADPSGALR
jgi:OMF family outer membrane factor